MQCSLFIWKRVDLLFFCGFDAFSLPQIQQFPIYVVHLLVFLKSYVSSFFLLILNTISMLLWTETWCFQIMYESSEYPGLAVWTVAQTSQKTF